MKDLDPILQRKRTFSSLWRLSFMFSFIPGFIPTNIENLLLYLPGTTNFGIGVVVASGLLVGSISLAIFGYFGGRISQKISRKKLLILTFGIWLGSYGLASFSPNYYFYLVFLLFAALGGGAFVPTSFSIISDFYSSSNRGQKYGTIQFGFMFGNGIGMIFGGLFGRYAGPFGWRFAYLFGSIIALINLVYFIINGVDPDTGGAEPELKNMEKDIKYDYKITLKKLSQIFKSKSMIAIYLFILTNGISGATLGTWAIFYLSTKIIADDPGLIATTIYLLAGIGNLFGAIIGGRLGDSYVKSGKLKGRAIISFFGTFTGSILMFLFYLLPFFTGNLFAIIFSWFFFLIIGFIGSILSSLYQGNSLATYSEVNVPELRSTANSFNGLMTNFGAIIGNLLISALIENNLSLLPFAISLVLTIQFIGGFFWLIPYFSYPKEYKKLRATLKNRRLELDGRTP